MVMKVHLVLRNGSRIHKDSEVSVGEATPAGSTTLNHQQLPSPRASLSSLLHVNNLCVQAHTLRLEEESPLNHLAAVHGGNVPNARRYLPLADCCSRGRRVSCKETGADAPSMEDFHILTVHISFWNKHSEDMSLPTASTCHRVLTQRDQQFCTAPANVTGKDRETLQKYHLHRLLAFTVSSVNHFT